MDANNKFESLSNDLHIKELQVQYEQLFNQTPPQRAKGIPNEYIVLFFQIVPTGIISFAVLSWVYDKLHSQDVDMLIGILITLFFFVFCQRFYSLPKRTARNAFRLYPALKTTVKCLKEPGSKFLPCASILKIEGKNLFLPRYGFVRWWEVKPYPETSGEINGMALVDEQGRVIDNVGLFEKAYATLVLSVLGDHTNQVRDRGHQSWSMYTLRSVLPRAEKAFKNKQQAKNFEANGLGQIYKQLLDDLPVLNQAMKTGLSIHVVHNKWRKALGWSFGLECRYEDAIEYQKTCLTYSRFMAAAYGSHLLNIKTRATQLLQTVNTADQWRGRKKLVWALSFFIGIVIAVESWIYTYGTLGQPGTKQLQSYQKKLMKARSLEMPVYKE